MNHVFVETNFIVDALRPFPKPAATALLDRVGGDVTLYIPWVAIAEAKRTMVRIISEDLGFMDGMLRFAALEFQSGQLSSSEKPVVDALGARAHVMRTAAINNASSRIDALAAQAQIIEPTRPVITKTLAVFNVKSLKPFDEMVLGAVLAKAEELHGNGERAIFFCNLNKKDFDPQNRPRLESEYSACGITFKSSFSAP